MAGSLSRRDIEMIFRADTDKATRPIAELGKAAKASRRDLEGLIDAADKGDVSLDRLADTTRDLKKAQDELGTARGLLTQLNAQEVALEKAEDKAASAAKKYADLKEQVDGAEAPTKRLTNSMDAAGRASEAAAARLETVRKEAAETRQQITAIIGPVDNVGDAFREIATTSADIARGLAVAGAAADDFKQRITAARNASAADDRKLNADVDFEQQGRSAGLLQAQIDYIAQFENRVELLAQAKRELAAQDAGFEKALAAQEAKVGSANVDELRRSITETFAAAERAEQITAFRQIAADARASAADVARFGVNQDEVAASTNRLATALSAILNPSAAANRTIEAIEGSVLAADAALKEGRKSAAEYNAILNDLSQAGAGIEKIARSVDAFKDQERAVAAARVQYQAAVADVNRIAAAIDAAEQPSADLTRELRTAESAVESAGNEMQRQTTRAAELAAALKRAGVDVDNLAAAERRLTDGAREAAAATQEVTSRQGGKGGLFGLSPTDATNLSYQINDIFTQLASGQSIFITLAQQGPQIWQIGGIKAYAAQLSGLLIPLAAVAGGLGVVAGAAALVYQASSPSAAEQQGAAYLASLGDAAGFTAAKYGELSNRLQDFGVKAEDAGALAQKFVQDGLDPSYIDSYTEALKNASDVTGTDMPAAADALNAALTGGYDAVVKLNEQFPVLTDAELAQIQALYESGQADEARQVIFDRFTSKYAEAAANMNGPWSAAWQNLKGAASDFGNYIGNTLSPYLQGLRGYLDSAAVGVNYLLLRLRGFDEQQAGIIAATQGGRVPTFRGGQARGGPAPQARSTAAGREAADEAEREQKAKGKTAKLEDRITAARLKARKDAQNRGFGTEDTRRLEDAAVADVRRVEGERQATAGAKAARKAEAARKKAQNEAEALAKRIDSAEEQLQSSLDSMQAKIARVAAGTLADQLKNATEAVDKEYDKLYRKLDDYTKLTNGKGMIGGQTITQYRATLDVNKSILANQRMLKVYEDNINDALAQRKARLAAIDDQRERGLITGAQAIDKTKEVTSGFEPIITGLVNAAVGFAKSIGGAKPSAEILAFIEKYGAIQQRTSGDSQADVTRMSDAALGQGENRLNQILAARNSLVEQYNTLNELGLITTDEAQKRSQAAYAASRGAIQQQIGVLQATLATARAAAAGNDALLLQYDAFAAKLRVLGAQADYVDPQMTRIKEGIRGILSQEAQAGIDKLIAAMTQLATGAKSVGGFFLAAGKALVEFVAQTVLAIARLVIQVLILKAIDAATNGLVSAYLKFLNGGGPGNGGAPGGGGGGFRLFGVKLFHGGGKVGEAGGQRRSGVSISPAALAAAPRYHEGVPSVGLKDDEQVAVLQNGERVLTERQQELDRQAKARTSGGGRGLRQVLAFGDDQVAAAMAGSAGEDVTVTHLRRNVPLLKQLVAE